MSDFPNKRPNIDVKTGGLKTVLLHDHWDSREGKICFLEKGDLFWEGDLLITLPSQYSDQQGLFAPASGIVDNFKVESINGSIKSDYNKILLQYYDIDNFDEIAPPVGVRPYYSFASGTYKVEYLEKKNGCDILEFYVARKKMPQLPEWDRFYVAQEVASTGDHVKKGQLLFLGFPTAPTRKQLADLKANDQMLTASDLLKALQTEIEAAQFEKTKLLKEINNQTVEAQEIVRSAKQEAIEKKAEFELDVEVKKSAILESARVQRKEAMDVKKVAEDEAKEAVGLAEQRGQSILADAHEKAEASKAEASAEIERIRAAASAQLQEITDNADQLELSAVTERLYSLMAGGEKASVLELPQLRTLYWNLGQLLADSQGVAAPETAERVKTFNMMDDMDAVYEYLAVKINKLDPDGTWPDDVRNKAIRNFSDVVEARASDLLGGNSDG